MSWLSAFKNKFQEEFKIILEKVAAKNMRSEIISRNSRRSDIQWIAESREMNDYDRRMKAFLISVLEIDSRLHVQVLKNDKVDWLKEGF